MPDITVNEIANSREPPRLNAVFVHGLGGDWKRTWLNEDGFFWPEELARAMKALTVCSIGYPSNKLSWNPGWPIAQAAGAVLDRLMSDPNLRASKAPIVFICHSLGGLVVKKVILTAQSDRGQDPSKGAFLDRVAGVVFLATPHGGSFMATIASQFHWFVSDSTRALKASDDNLLDLSVSYRNCIADNHARICHKVYYETEGVWGAKPVDATSVDPGITGVRPVAIGRNHIEICKPSDQNDQVYTGVLAFLEDEVLAPRPPTHGEQIGAVKEDTQAIRENVDRLTAELSMSVADREALVADLAKVKAEHGGTVDLVSRFLETMVGRKVAPEQFTATLFKIAGDWKSAGEKIDALSYSGNLSPDLSVVRDQAKAAHEAGRLDEAEKLLGQIGRAEIDALKRLEEEIQLRKRGVADTKAAQAAVAHARLNYRDAAALYGEAASLVASFDAESRLERLIAQAGELFAQGDEFGDNAELYKSIELYRVCLAQTPRERVPLKWAGTQNNLGSALWRLGERESGTARLEEAVAAYREALQERTRARVPLDWAATQNNLGLALATLGSRERETARLEEAVAAFRESLQENTRALVPLYWATTQTNLGLALEALGSRESETARLEEAVSAFREVLQERTRAGAPLDWAMTQNNLGAALQALGERESGTARLEEAVAAYSEALQGFTPARAPLQGPGAPAIKVSP